MKRKLIVTVLALVLAMTFVCGLCACGNDAGNEGVKNVTFLFADSSLNILKEINLETEAEYLADALDGLEGVTFDIGESVVYGKYINSFTCDGVTYGNFSSGPYVYLYCSSEDIEYIDLMYSIELSGQKYYSLGNGMSKSAVLDGITYIITVL